MEATIVKDIVQVIMSHMAKLWTEKLSPAMVGQPELDYLERTLFQIVPVMEDAERRQVNDASIRHWFDKLRDIRYDMEDLLDECKTAILKLEIQQGYGVFNKVYFCISSSFFKFGEVSQLGQRRRVAPKIKSLKERWASVNTEREMSIFNIAHRLNEQAELPNEQPRRPETASFLDVSKIYGREEEKSFLIRELLGGSNKEGPLPGVIPVLGMGGMGKTTLAQQAFNHKKVQAHFQLMLWVCVSDPFDVLKISRAILEDIPGKGKETGSLNLSQLRLRDALRGKKFLLVLDDVWIHDRELWGVLKTPLDVGAAGSRILVTTRDENVANMIRTTAMISLGKLSEEDCWLIFSQIAFSGRNATEFRQLEETGRKIVHKCQGLPLAAKSLGSLMSGTYTPERWEEVLYSNIWEFKDVTEKIFAPLLLSYFHMSAAARSCFSYCAIFPKDHLIGRDNLIQLWMSQGYLDFNSERKKEILGEECFQELAMLSMFQDFKKDYKGTIISCRMHDLVHDLAQFLRRYECFTTKVGNATTETKPLTENARHSTFVLASEAASPVSAGKGKSLRTLFLFCSTNTAINPKLFMHLKCLRTLNMNECSFKDLPKEVGEFIHLRYLNLSGNEELERIPETLCDLYNLQTLLLKDCWRLQRLPEAIGKLVNLRHLQIKRCFSLDKLPKGVAELAVLQTLDMIVVPRSDKNEAFQLEDLKRLKNLRSSLRICRCGYLGGVSEAKKAELMNRKDLVDLTLDFDRSGDGPERSLHDKEILEALQPHPHVESVKIRKYRGTTMSLGWIMHLTNLKRLVLYSCQYCELLPPLGKLPSLESLKVHLLKSVEKVGLEFLGIETDIGAETTSFISFPKLRELSFSSLSKWKVWGGREGYAEENSYTSVMPCLQTLEIRSCRFIQELPDFLRKTPLLQNLMIIDCNVLQELYEMGTGREWAKISHISNININYQTDRRHSV